MDAYRLGLGLRIGFGFGLGLGLELGLGVGLELGPILISDWSYRVPIYIHT